MPADDGKSSMDDAIIDQAVKVCLREIHSRVTEAVRIANAAEACANAGSIAEAVTISMDIGQLIHEARQLRGAASLLRRLLQQ
jgi:hypothetical protein